MFIAFGKKKEVKQNNSIANIYNRLNKKIFKLIWKPIYLFIFYY